ncbi:MAG: hypothetical protein O7F71_00090 [Gammaproteobacteria bacterium]|nr:hypothetical protein [Gammaproteobacteria bacterium]
MTEILSSLSAFIAESSVRELVIYLLRNVPGFPPIIQTVHILAIAAVMGSIVFINLRILGIAVPSQQLSEMIQRLLPWTWWALLSLAISGLVFIIARPDKYFFNPVFGIKFALLVPAVMCAWIIHRKNTLELGYWDGSALRRGSARAIAAVSMILWLGVMMAGRWIAYYDYLFWPES